MVTPGPVCVFDGTRVEGTKGVNPAIVLAELEWEPSQPFSLEKIKGTRENLLKLQLFTSIRIGWEERKERPWIVPMLVSVTERPPRDLKVSVGYSTQDEARGQLQWIHHDFFGGGRQFSATLQGSNVTSAAIVQFTQPHLLSNRTNGVFELRYEHEVEDPFVLNVARFFPRLEHRFSPHLTGVGGVRVGLASVTSVPTDVAAAIGGVKRRGVYAGPGVGLIWNTTEDPLNPKRGELISLSADQPGGLLGGNYRFYKIAAEAKKYWAVLDDTVFAARLKVGIGGTLGTAADFPIFERYFLGGERTVRGYGRWRLGPRSASNVPLGGLSLVAGSFELRQPIWGGPRRDRIRGLRSGLTEGRLAARRRPQVRRRSRLELPLAGRPVDVGFPLSPPDGDRRWQVVFSVGQFF